MSTSTFDKKIVVEDKEAIDKLIKGLKSKPKGKLRKKHNTKKELEGSKNTLKKSLFALKDYLEIVCERNIKAALRRFSCSKDADIKRFLMQKAITFEENGKCRTYFYVDHKALEEGEVQILGYFSIALKSALLDEELTKERRQELDGVYQRTDQIAVYLIGQLAKNDLYRNEVSGSELIEKAMDIILDCYERIGGRIVLVECLEIEKVIQFYLNNGFEEFQRKGNLIQLIRFL